MSKLDYFASKPADELGTDLMNKIDNYNRFLIETGRMRLWKHSYDMYHAPARAGSRLQTTGQQGEFTSIDVNHYRNLLSHLKTMTTSQRPAFEPKATNTDYKSQAQTILASGLLDYYMREKKLDRILKTAVEHALVFGEGFVRVTWDSSLGELYGIDENGNPQQEGDIDYKNFLPQLVIRDFTKNSASDHDWYILVTRQNRFTVMAKFPELADKIEEVQSFTDYEQSLRYSIGYSNDTDDIAVYEFYHKPTAAMPNGRVTTFVDSDVILLDGPLPYRTLPVFRISPDDQIDSCFGYTVGFDLMPILEAGNRLHSAVISNQSAFAVQNILLPKGSDINVSSISGGMNVVEYDPKLGPPSPMNLTSTPVEVFNYIAQLEQLAETLSGINSVARGNPEASLKSGAALALVQSQAIQFSAGLQQSYAGLMEDLGTATINTLRDFAKAPRVAIIAGKSQRSLMKQFTGDDLDMINRVTVDMGNPLTRTTAGRTQLAETLMQNGLVKTPEQYIQVLSTGRLEPVIEGEQAELLNIKAENEELAQGRQVPVMITDSHKIHINEHKAILASPEARRDPALIQVVTEHLMEHLNFLQDPELAPLLAVLGQETMAQPPAMGGGPAAAPSEMLDATNPLTQEAAKVQQPKMPGIPEVQ